MKYYAITDPKYYTNTPSSFQSILQKMIDNNTIDMVCFRDKISNNTEELIESFVSICKLNNVEKTFINTNIELAYKYKSYGVHLTSKQFDNIKDAKALSLKVIVSCHSEEEIVKAIDLNADYITYSPIYHTPNKGEPKGINKLKEIVEKYPQINIIALGGIISDNQIKEIEKTNSFGFASIRYFVK